MQFQRLLQFSDRVWCARARAFPAPIVVVYAKLPRQDRSTLWPDLVALTAARRTCATQYNRIGKLVLRHWVSAGDLFTTRDIYSVRWFSVDHAAQYSLKDGFGLRVWSQGCLIPWGSLHAQ